MADRLHGRDSIFIQIASAVAHFRKQTNEVVNEKVQEVVCKKRCNRRGRARAGGCASTGSSARDERSEARASHQFRRSARTGRGPLHRREHVPESRALGEIGRDVYERAYAGSVRFVSGSRRALDRRLAEDGGSFL